MARKDTTARALWAKRKARSFMGGLRGTGGVRAGVGTSDGGKLAGFRGRKQLKDFNGLY
jgi:hypothetical protein